MKWKEWRVILIINLKFMELRKATRQQSKLRIWLSWPSWSWKTYSALQLAFWLTGDWNKVAVIDTENGSADLYSHLWDYNTLILEAPFSPERYIEAIKTCENAGVGVIVIDSITHEWDWAGWIIEISNNMQGNSFTNWWKLTPRHNNFINAILQSSCHILTTVRRKQEYALWKDEKTWKSTVEKLWLKEITREWFEYELTINFDIDRENHKANASKDRTWLFEWRDFFLLTKEIWEEIKNWNLSGEKVKSKEEISQELFSEYFEELQKCDTLDLLKEVFTKINDNKLKFIEKHLKELTDLKDQIKNNLSENV